MKKLIPIIAALVMSSSVYASCPSALSGTYSGTDIAQNQNLANFNAVEGSDIHEMAVVTYKFSGNSMLLMTEKKTVYQNGDKIIDGQVRSGSNHYTNGYDKSSCTLIARKNSNNSKEDLYAVVSNSGNSIEGIHFDSNGNNYVMKLTKQ